MRWAATTLRSGLRSELESGFLVVPDIKKAHRGVGGDRVQPAQGYELSCVGL